MPFNPFKDLTGKHSCTLFEIRLDDDFIIFRGNEHEAAGQLLRGTVVLCLPSALKVEDVHLRLIGQLRLAWLDSKATPSGMSTQKIDRSRITFEHRWNPFVAARSGSKSTTLEAGNYEWPFELELPGSLAESVEGLPNSSLTYRLKATIARGKLAYDIHAYKHLRIVRTLEPAALEFLHAMSVENVWVNKIEYSIVIPQKAVVFGGTVPLDMRFTPLLKGLEMGDITVKLVEIQEFVLQGPYGHMIKDHHHEREVERWHLKVNKDEHWQDVIEETSQEGWVVHAPLPLPKKLRECVQDVNMPGIKIRHKLRLNVGLRNPDGHVSELRATLPITIFISPNMLLDDQGNLVRQQPGVVSPVDVAAIAPPGYGEHILDQLYDDVPMAGFQSPPLQSGLNSPLYSQSRAGSLENLPHDGIAPAALSSRLQNVAAVTANSSIPSSTHATNPNSTSISPRASSTDQSQPPSSHHASSSLNTPSTDLSRRTSNDEPAHNDLTATTITTPRSGARTPAPARSGHRTPEEHLELGPELDMTTLSRVPSYATAVRTGPPSRNSPATGTASAPPDYRTTIAMALSSISASAPCSPTHRETDPLATAGAAAGMETIHEITTHSTHSSSSSSSGNRDRASSASSGRSSRRSSRSLGRGVGAGRGSDASTPRSSASFVLRGAAGSFPGLGFLSSHLHLTTGTGAGEGGDEGRGRGGGRQQHQQQWVHQGQGQRVA